MTQVPYKLWAEQDERTSRLMLRIGDDPPVQLFMWERAWAHEQARKQGLQEADFHKLEGDQGAEPNPPWNALP